MTRMNEGQYGFAVAFHGKGAQSDGADSKLRQIMSAVSDADLIKTLKGRGYSVSRGAFAKCFVSAVLGGIIAVAVLSAIGG